MNQTPFDGTAHMAANPFKRTYRPTAKNPATLRTTSSLDDILALYEESLDTAVDGNNYHHGVFYNSISQKVDPRRCITPSDINQFILLTQSFEKHEYYTHTTGMWISLLMNRAYNQGHNKFYLDLQNTKPLDCIGFNLAGNRNKKIKVMIEGTVGDEFGAQSQHAVFYCREGNLLFSPSFVNSTFYLGRTSILSGRVYEHFRIRINGYSQSCYQMLPHEFEAAWNHAKKIIERNCNGS